MAIKDWKAEAKVAWQQNAFHQSLAAALREEVRRRDTQIATLQARIMGLEAAIWQYQHPVDTATETS